ncbi:MAG TPA: hypothetical protein VEY30_03905, partial [Myxococcaceae bacterium]|nr:hypothetical protein [Myxococcaceae bacterium]
GTISVESDRNSPGLRVGENSALASFLSGLSGIPPGVRSYFTDAVDLSRFVAPTAIVIGGGDIETAHKEGEYLPEQDLVRTVNLFDQVVENL